MVKKLYLLILGLIWLLYYGYAIIISKLPKELIPKLTIQKIIIMMLAIFMIITSIIRLIILWKTYKKTLKESAIWVKKLKQLADFLYIKPLKYVWDTIFMKRRSIQLLVDIMITQIINRILTFTHIICFIITYYYIPRLIAIFVLYIEVVFYGQFNIYYKLLLLILLPRILQGLLYSFHEYIENKKKNLEKEHAIIGTELKNDKLYFIIKEKQTISLEIQKQWSFYSQGILTIRDILQVQTQQKNLLVFEFFIICHTLEIWLYCLLINLIKLSI